MRGQIVHFLDHIAYERGLSPNTQAAYATDLRAFVTFLEDRCGIACFPEVTRDHIAAFIQDQRQRQMCAATRARRLIAIKVLFAYLCAEGNVPSDVTAVMDAPDKGQQLPHTLSEKEVARLLESVSGNSPHEVRDRSMLELFYACGLRVSEVTSLRVSDVRLEEGLVRCVGKGNKQRLIPLGSQAADWLVRYLSQARPRFAHGNTVETCLFLTQRGIPFTRQGVFAMLVKRAYAAQLCVAVSPHVLRHCFASHLLTHGAQIRAIQEMLGHADIATTQVYTHVDNGHVTRTHAQYHPRH